MADRHWVPVLGVASGTWDTTSTTNWSTTNGGSPGASAPTSTDNALFDSGSGLTAGDNTITITSGTCANLDCTGASVAPAFTSLFAITFNGSVTLISGGSFAVASFTLNAPGGGATLTTAGTSINVGTGNFITSGGNVVLQDNLVVAGNTSGRGTWKPGNVDLNGFTVSCSSFQPQGGTIEWNGGIINVVGQTNAFLYVSGVTLQSTAGLGQLNMNNATSFEWNVGSGSPTLTNINTTFIGSCTTWSNSTTFNDLTLSAGKNYAIPYGNTQTVAGNFDSNGTSSSFINISASGSAGSGPANLCLNTYNVPYTKFTNITASCALIDDPTGDDGGGNTGIDFGATGAPLGLLLEL